MSTLNALSRDGATQVLNRLCLGEARFKELNKAVSNTRTLTRRLDELVAEGLIKRVRSHYDITSDGFEAALKIAELERKVEPKWLNRQEMEKIRYGWIRTPLSRLTDLLIEEFGDELVSLILYGSLAKGSFKPGRSDIDLLYILQDGSEKVWQREASVFRTFQSTWEYRASEHWFKTQGYYGFPEVTTVWLQKSYAKKFQPIYLDMLSHRAVLYDQEGFFQNLIRKLEEALKALGTIRVEHPDGTCMWLLKPDLAPGEPIEISLG